MKKVLMCPPNYYDIEYQINAWMDISNKVDRAKVQEQYQKLKKIYEELGCEILEISQEQGLPDMVYAANPGFPKGNVFVKSNFKHDERKKEADLAANYLKERGYIVKALPADCVFEGQGDLLAVGGTFVMGWGKRSNQQAVKNISEMLEIEILDLELNDPYYYHLDTCLLLLDEKTTGINALSFTEEGLKKLHERFQNIIEVGEEDNKVLACNSVIIGKTIVCGEGISQELKDQYAMYGFSVIETPMTEYMKGGGSVKCLTLEFF